MNGEPLVLQLDGDVAVDRALIGGKASSLVRLIKLGATVPPAFVLTTAAFKRWSGEQSREFVRGLIVEGLAALEHRTDRKLGSASLPLIVSVRSGAPVSMPGMMDTVLNVGMGSLSDGSPGHLYDARARFLFQFGELVLKLESTCVDNLRDKWGPFTNAAAVSVVEKALRQEAQLRGMRWPACALDELVEAATAVFESWHSERAVLYRRLRRIDERIGTTVTIQQMVFGNRNDHSGSGVAFTRDPSTGLGSLSGEFLTGGQGEDVVAGRQTASALSAWRESMPHLYDQLSTIGTALETEGRAVQEIEFTVDDDRLYVLQCRPAKLTPSAAAVVAVALVEEGRCSEQQAVEYAMQHGFDASRRADPQRVVAPDAIAIAKGLAVGGGAASGRLAVNSSAAFELIDRGVPVVFAAMETSPKLLPVMRAAAALMTMHGGASSHAAVVAREMGLSCVVGLGGTVGPVSITVQGKTIEEGEWLTVNGDTGNIYPGNRVLEQESLLPEHRLLYEWAKHAEPQGPTK